MQAHRASCQRVVCDVLGKNDWRLLSQQELTEHVLAGVSEGEAADEKHLRQLAVRGYCEKGLYPACMGQTNEFQQRRAFVEINWYLKKVAVGDGVPPEAATEAAQSAIKKLFEKRNAIRTPGGILMYAIRIMWTAVRDNRAAEHRAVTEADMGEPSDEGIGVSEVTPEDEAAQNELRQQLRQQLLATLDALLKQRPRARKQLEAVRLRYVEEMSTAETAQRMGLKEAQVYPLLSRGLALLRNDEKLRALAREFLHLGAEAPPAPTKERRRSPRKRGKGSAGAAGAGSPSDDRGDGTAGDNPGYRAAGDDTGDGTAGDDTGDGTTGDQ
ncbi:MAG: sigma-70 family RNA polymerase sigma factor [Anaerolineae bacterium]